MQEVTQLSFITNTRNDVIKDSWGAGRVIRRWADSLMGAEAWGAQLLLSRHFSTVPRQSPHFIKATV